MWRVIACMVLCACAASPIAEILGGGGTRVSVAIALAESESERRNGLRGYDSLADDEGLVLVFPAASEVCITNEGVVFAIDAVFVEGGLVTALETFDAGEAEPRCHRADEVLEVAAGVASRVLPGDTFRR